MRVRLACGTLERTRMLFQTWSIYVNDPDGIGPVLTSDYMSVSNHPGKYYLMRIHNVANIWYNI